MKWYGVIIFFLSSFVIAVIAAVVIHFIEANNEIIQSASIIQTYNSFKDSNPCLDGNEIRTLYTNINQINNVGIYLQKDRSYISTWNVQSSIYMSLQVIGTLGFAGSPPQTTGGKVFLIFYLIFGVPLLITSFFCMGDQIIKISEFFRSRLKCKFGIRQIWQVTLIRTFFGLVFGLIVFSLVPSAIFKLIDSSLDFGNTVSILTSVLIGYGEFATTNSQSGWYGLLVGIFSVLSAIYFQGLIISVKVSYATYNTELVNNPELLKKEIVGVFNSAPNNIEIEKNAKKVDLETENKSLPSTIKSEKDFGNNSKLSFYNIPRFNMFYIRSKRGMVSSITVE